MSDKTNKLGSLASRLKDGLAKINTDAKSKAESKSSNTQNTEHDATELFDDDNMGPAQSNTKHDRLTASDEDISDALIIEGEAIPQTGKKKGSMTTKQKLLLAIVCVVGAVVYTKMQTDALHTPSAVKAGSPAASQESKAIASNSDISVPAFDLEKGQSQDDKAIPVSTSIDHDNAFGSATGHVQDPANAPIGNDVLTADLNDQLGNLTEDGDQTLDPFSGAVSPTPKQPVVVPISSAPTVQKTPPPSSSKIVTADPKSVLKSPVTSVDSPFAVGGSNSTGLSGAKNQNADSKKGELLDQSANADVAKLKANIAEKDGRIVTLETEIGHLKSDLAHQTELADAKSKGKTVPKVAQHKPMQASHATKRSTPTQRVASAPKATPRPQICVTAVAQAARNCTTCVPHAFISHKGSETMVGQGDYIEGLRVNIVGDRLDLQDAKGDVVHKFWSSPNGCAG
jgi:hypothetical protein